MTTQAPANPSEHRKPARAAVLLVNLGTPDAPSAGAIRRYLRQFLSDRRVVEVPWAVWQMVLNLFILPFRPGKLVHAYGAVWSPEGSPLMAISRRQTQALHARLNARYPQDGVAVELVMTYGEPSFASVLSKLAAQRVERVAVLPLYPQYSATTTAAAFDALWRVLMRQRRVPAVRTLDSYHDEPAYIAALAASVRAHWTQQGRDGHLLMSFHSIPQIYLAKGDPYFCLCQKTARLLAEALELPPAQWSVSFQSRLGNQPWLRPYTDVVIPQLAQGGVSALDVICPGFSADCLETLEEVALRYRDAFLEAGGKRFHYIPALNDAAEHIDLLERLAVRELHGWLPIASDAPDPARVAELQAGLDADGLLRLPGARA